MKDRKKPALVMVVAALLIPLAAGAAPVLGAGVDVHGELAKASECRMHVSPSYAEIQSAEFVTVAIAYLGYDPLQEVRGITVTVDFDTTVVAVDHITEGGFLSREGPTQFYSNVVGGQATIDCAIIGGYSGTYGFGIYAVIVFEGVLDGTTAVHLSSVSVRDPDNQPIPADLGHGTIVVYSPTAAEELPVWAIKKMFK